MSRRRQSNAVEALFFLLFLIIQTIVAIIVHLILFLFDFISFFTTKYKQKSGNNFFKTYFNKGNYGEFVLYRKAVRIFGKNSVLTNIYLDNKNTLMTEIDVLAVSTKGIYVFEMKNYSGYIYGSEKDQQWTQVLNRWTKHQFYNPLRQNYAHTKAVESYLEVPNSAIIPMVVFSNRSKLSKIDVSEFQNIFQYRDAISYVKRHEKIAEVVLTTQQTEDYLISLIDRCNMSEEVKQKHILEVKALQSKAENLSKQ